MTTEEINFALFQEGYLSAADIIKANPERLDHVNLLQQEGYYESAEFLHKWLTKQNDPVNHPSHYTFHPSKIECIEITQHMGFCLGNAMKYIWRADLKNDAIEDLKKAEWYIRKEIEKREKANKAS